MVDRETYDSIANKIDYISDYIVNSKESEKMIDKVLNSGVKNIFKLYERKGIIDLSEKVNPELKVFWNDVLRMMGKEAKEIFNEKEKSLLRTYGEIPCIAFQSLYDSAVKHKRDDLSSRIETMMWAIEQGIFNHPDLKKLESFYKSSKK